MIITPEETKNGNNVFTTSEKLDIIKACEKGGVLDEEDYKKLLKDSVYNEKFTQDLITAALRGKQVETVKTIFDLAPKNGTFKINLLRMVVLSDLDQATKEQFFSWLLEKNRYVTCFAKIKLAHVQAALGNYSPEQSIMESPTDLDDEFYTPYLYWVAIGSKIKNEKVAINLDKFFEKYSSVAIKWPGHVFSNFEEDASAQKISINTYLLSEYGYFNLDLCIYLYLRNKKLAGAVEPPSKIAENQIFNQRLIRLATIKKKFDFIQQLLDDFPDYTIDVKATTNEGDNPFYLYLFYKEEFKLLKTLSMRYHRNKVVAEPEVLNLVLTALIEKQPPEDFQNTIEEWVKQHPLVLIELKQQHIALYLARNYPKTLYFIYETNAKNISHYNKPYSSYNQSLKRCNLIYNAKLIYELLSPYANRKLSEIEETQKGEAIAFIKKLSVKQPEREINLSLRVGPDATPLKELVSDANFKEASIIFYPHKPTNSGKLILSRQQRRNLNKTTDKSDSNKNTLTNNKIIEYLLPAIRHNTKGTSELIDKVNFEKTDTNVIQELYRACIAKKDFDSLAKIFDAVPKSKNIKINVLYHIVYDFVTLPTEIKKLEKYCNWLLENKRYENCNSKLTHGHICAILRNYTNENPPSNLPEHLDANNMTPYMYALAAGNKDNFTINYNEILENAPQDIAWNNFFERIEEQSNTVTNIKKYFLPLDEINIKTIIYLYKRNKKISGIPSVDIQENDIFNEELIAILLENEEYEFLQELQNDFSNKSIDLMKKVGKFPQPLYLHFYNKSAYSLLATLLPQKTVQDQFVYQILINFGLPQLNKLAKNAVNKLDQFLQEHSDKEWDFTHYQIGIVLVKNMPTLFNRLIINNFDKNCQNIKVYSAKNHNILNEEFMYYVFFNNTLEETCKESLPIIIYLRKNFSSEFNGFDLKKIVGINGETLETIIHNPRYLLMKFDPIRSFISQNAINRPTLPNPFKEDEITDSKNPIEFTPDQIQEIQKLVTPSYPSLPSNDVNKDDINSSKAQKKTKKTTSSNSFRSKSPVEKQGQTKTLKNEFAKKNPPLTSKTDPDELLEAELLSLTKVKFIVGQRPTKEKSCAVIFNHTDIEILRRFKQVLQNHTKLTILGPTSGSSKNNSLPSLTISNAMSHGALIDLFTNNRPFQTALHEFVKVEAERQKKHDEEEEKKFILTEEIIGNIKKGLETAFSCLKNVEITWENNQIKIHVPLSEEGTIQFQETKAKQINTIIMVGTLSLNKIVLRWFNNLDKTLPGLKGECIGNDIYISIGAKSQKIEPGLFNQVKEYILEIIENKRALPKFDSNSSKSDVPERKKEEKDNSNDKQDIKNIGKENNTSKQNANELSNKNGKKSFSTFTEKDVHSCLQKITDELQTLEIGSHYFLGEYQFQFLKSVDKNALSSQLELSYKSKERETIGPIKTSVFLKSIAHVFNQHVPGLVKFYSENNEAKKDPSFIISYEKLKDSKNPFTKIKQDKEFKKQIVKEFSDELVKRQNIILLKEEQRANGLFSLSENKVKNIKFHLEKLDKIKQYQHLFTDEIDKIIFFCYYTLHSYRLNLLLARGSGNENRSFYLIRNILRHGHNDSIIHDLVDGNLNEKNEEILSELTRILNNPKPIISIFKSHLQFFQIPLSFSQKLNDKTEEYAHETTKHSIGKFSLDMTSKYTDALARFDKMKSENPNLFTAEMWLDMELGIRHCLGEIEAQKQIYDSKNYEIFYRLHSNASTPWNLLAHQAADEVLNKKPQIMRKK